VTSDGADVAAIDRAPDQNDQAKHPIVGGSQVHLYVRLHLRA